MDIFSSIVPASKQHPNFTSIFQERNRFALDVLTDWARGFSDRDGKFVKQFQTTFDSSFWELYIFSVLKHFRCTVDFKYSSPDFVVNGPTAFCLEATVAVNDTRTKPPHQTVVGDIPSDLNTFNTEAIIRLSNSFTSKHKKFKDFYAHLSHVSDKPFVLAIAAFDRPCFNMQCQRAIEALLYGYYVDEEAYIAGQDFSAPPIGNPIQEVIKYNGAIIETGLFYKEEYSDISCVFFNPCATWGKALALSHDPNSHSVFTSLKLNMNGGITPHVVRETKQRYSEHLIDGLRIYHNPRAHHALPRELFRDKRVFQLYWDSQMGYWVYEQHDGQLLFRRVETILSTAEANIGRVAPLELTTPARSRQ